MHSSFRSASEERRQSVRFSNVVHQEVFDPDVTFDRSSLSSQQLQDMSMGPGQENRNETGDSFFRVPLPPSSVGVKPRPLRQMIIPQAGMPSGNGKPDKEDGKQEKKEQGDRKMITISISPGTGVTNNKFEEKMKRLEAKRQKDKEAREARRAQLPPTAPPKVDMGLTEMSFLDHTQQNTETNVKPPASSFCPPPPPPCFSDISVIHPSDVTLLTTPRKTDGIRNQTPMCSTPFRRAPSPIMGVASAMRKLAPPTPAKASQESITDVSIMYEDYGEKLDRQMRALSVWCNMLLRTDVERKDTDLGKNRKEADRKLQDLLTKPIGRVATANAEATKKFTYADFLQRQARDEMREKAADLFARSDVPEKIRAMVMKKVISIRDQCGMYCNLHNQKTMLHLFLAFHPAWLHLGLETVFGEPIPIGENQSFVAVISRFILTRVFSDPQIMKNKKFAVGTVKMTVTPAGREALHCHFLTQACLFFFFVETAKHAGVIRHNPRMFNKTAHVKSLDQVFSEMSREIMSASGMTLGKALAKVGFKPTFKQGFFDDFDFRVEGFASLTDGVVLRKLVEVVCECSISGLREPRGDRLRKVGNVNAVLEAARRNKLEVGALKADAIVGGNREAILELLWRIVGVYVFASEEKDLRRESLVLANRRLSDFGCVGDATNGEELVLHVCRQIGEVIGVQVNSIDDLRDGRLLAGAWRIYNPTAPDVHFFPGKNLYKQVVSAAETELGVPLGLHGAVPLFAHIYLSRLFNIRKLNDAATRIQKAYRGYRMLRMIRNRVSVGRTLFSPIPDPDDLSSINQNTYVVCGRAEGSCAEYTEMACTPAASSLCAANESTLTALGIEDLPVSEPTVVPSETTVVPREATVVSSEATVVHTSDSVSTVVSATDADTLTAGSSASSLQTAFACATFSQEDLASARETFVRQMVDRSFAAPLDISSQLWSDDDTSFDVSTGGPESRTETGTDATEGMAGQLDEPLPPLSAGDVSQFEDEMECELRSLEELEAVAARREKEQEAVAARREKEKEAVAAICELQAIARGTLFRRELERQREEEAARQLEEKRARDAEEKMIREREAAVKIQSHFRGWLARRDFRALVRVEQENRLCRMERAAGKIQCFYRQHLARVYVDSLREQQNRRLEAVILIQKLVRGFLARRQLPTLIEDRKKYVENVVKIQSLVRGFLARRRVLSRLQRERRESQATCDLLNEALCASEGARDEAREETSGGARETEGAREEEQEQEVKRQTISLRAIYNEIRALRARQNAYRIMIERMTAASARVNHRPRNATQEELCAAAVKLQSWWRGVVARRQMAPHLAQRAHILEEYGYRLATEDGCETQEKLRPAVERLFSCSDRIFDDCVTNSLRATHCINRLTELSPSLLVQFVVECRGVTVVLEKMRDLDRGPAMTEVAEVLVQIMKRIFQSSDAKIREMINPCLKDCVEQSFHLFHAHYRNDTIVSVSADCLMALWTLPDAKPFFNKAPFFLSYAKRRIGGLAETHPRRRAINRLRDALRQ